MQPGKFLSVGLLCAFIGSLAVAGNGGSDEVVEPFAQGTGQVDATDIGLTADQVAALAAERRAQRSASSTRGRGALFGRRSQPQRTKSDSSVRRNNNRRGQLSRQGGRKRR